MTESLFSLSFKRVSGRCSFCKFYEILKNTLQNTSRRLVLYISADVARSSSNILNGEIYKNCINNMLQNLHLRSLRGGVVTTPLIRYNNMEVAVEVYQKCIKVYRKSYSVTYLTVTLLFFVSMMIRYAFIKTT